jgi:hypothetical protein
MLRVLSDSLRRRVREAHGVHRAGGRQMGVGCLHDAEYLVCLFSAWSGVRVQVRLLVRLLSSTLSLPASLPIVNPSLFMLVPPYPFLALSSTSLAPLFHFNTQSGTDEKP